MKRVIKSSLFILAIAGGALSLAAHAEHGKAGAGKGADKKEFLLKHLSDVLGLSDDQTKKLTAAFEAHQKAEKPLRRELRDARQKLGDQLEDKASDADLKATLDKLDKAEKDLRAEKDRFHAGMDGILTIQQRAKHALMKGHAKMGPKGKGMGPGMRGGKGMGGPGGKGGGRPDKDVPADEEGEDEGPGDEAGGPPQEE